MIIRVIHNLTACKYRLQFFISTVFQSLAILFYRLGIDVANAWVDLLLAYPFFFIGNICANANSLRVANKTVRITPHSPSMSDCDGLASCCVLHIRN